MLNPPSQRTQIDPADFSGLKQGSHITRWPGFYILQWRFLSSAACAASSMPRVDDVLASLQVSSHKCKIMYYTEVLASCDFRSVWYFYFFGVILRLFFTAQVLCKTLNIYTGTFMQTVSSLPDMYSLCLYVSCLLFAAEIRIID